VPPAASQPLGFFRNSIAAIGAVFIHALIRIFGRTLPRAKAVWLWGPIGGDHIGDKPYEELAAQENLTVSRRVTSGGLIPDIRLLGSMQCLIGHVRPEIRDFYEQTAAYRMDVWSRTYFPGNIGLWLMVTTLSRRFDQLNFPLSALDTAKGIDSEIVHLTHADGSVRYAGWHRRMNDTGRTIYTGFYMTELLPGSQPCVKVVFPMPNGNATVLLRPSVYVDGSLRLSSNGRYFGDAGFYRIDRIDADYLRVWRVRTLREEFHLYVDDANVLRCDHSVRFLRLPVLHLHYRIERRRDLPPPPPPAATNRVDAASKRIRATADRVYQAFADPRALERWLPPFGMKAAMLRFEFVEGGGYHMRLTQDFDAMPGKSADNADDVVVRYLKLLPNRRIEQAVTFISDAPLFAGEMLMTWELEAKGAYTQVTVQCENVPPGIRAIENKQALESTLIHLANYLSED
jgi:uncharacterized protein YndB with AHSA1/START domain